MKLSLCVIVRDEIAHLDDCLDSIEHLVDEIVIVDTGSEDGTWELVQRRADIFDQIEWEGFAAARNHCQGLATGDWIVILDADEVISDTTGWKKGIEAAASGEYDAVAFVLFNQLPDDQILNSDRIWQVRMYGRRPEITWIGSVHNQIAHALQKYPLDGKEAKFFQAKVLIDHKGYNLPKEVMQKKYIARMASLAEELKKAKDPKTKAYYQFQTANALFMQSQYDDALTFIRDCNFKHMTVENAYSTSLMAVHCCHILGVEKEGMEFAKGMLDMNPDESMSFLMMGLAYLSGGRYQAAYNFLGATMAMVQMKGMQYKYSLDQHYIAAACGEAALNLKRYGDAKELFKMHLQKYQTERIVELEAAIIPMDQAVAQGMVQANGQMLPEAGPLANPGDGVSIPDVRTSDLESPSEESPSDVPAPK